MMVTALRATFELARPLNTLLTFGSVLLGGWIVTETLTLNLVIAGLSAAAIAAGGYIHNDLCDRHVDRISHPARPLPTGRISTRAATSAFLASFVFGTCLTAALPTLSQIAAAIILVALILYNCTLKKRALIGNALVGIVGGAPFVYGGIAVGHWGPTLLPGALAAYFHFTREIVKDLQDVEGDESNEGRTLAIRLGDRGTKAIISALLVGLVVTIPVPSFVGLAGSGYLLISLPLCALLLLALVTVLQAEHHRDLAIPSRLLKGGMLIGILAFWADKLV